MAAEIKTYNALAERVNSKLRAVQRSGMAYEHALAQIAAHREKLEIEKAKVNEIKTALMHEKARSEDFLSKKSSALNDLTNREKKKKEQIKRYMQAAKESLSKITFTSLPSIKHDAGVDRLFKFFFINLYYEKPEKFDYAKFVSVALKDQKVIFQKKLAAFNMAFLTAEKREEIKEIKEMNFSLNDENEDLGVMLEWLDYTYEVYLLLKEDDELKAKIALVPAVEARYNYIVENKSKLIGICDRNLAQLERYMEYLQQLNTKIGAAAEEFKSTSELPEISEKAASALALIENFHNLPEVSEIKKAIS